MSDETSSSKITLDDLLRLAYFTGKDVTLAVGGGHANRAFVRHDCWVYDLDADQAELRELILSCTFRRQRPPR